MVRKWRKRERIRRDVKKGKKGEEGKRNPHMGRIYKSLLGYTDHSGKTSGSLLGW